MATLQNLFFNNRSYRYWTEREKAQRELYMKEEAQQQKELERIYSDMYRWAEDEINRFYGKYATAEGIDITEAKKRVTQLDIEEYEKLAKQYVTDAEEYRKKYGVNGGRAFSERAKQEMRLYNATMKINRLEMLKARIGVHLVDGINTIDQYYEDVITDRTRAEIERQAGILGETVSVADTTKRAKNIVNASFFNATYSERIWSHQDRLRSMINIELQRGLIAGVGSREMASRIKREFDVSLADAHRLMVTELRRVQTDVAMDSYKESGVERYVYLAVNPRACPICRELDGKDFAVSEAKPAKNAPPMHPRCHCTTAPYVDEDEYNAWLNYLNQGGRTSDWEQMSLAERQKYANPVVQSTQAEPTIESAQTVAEVEDLMKQQGWFSTDTVDLSGCDLESAKSVYRAHDKVFSKFPFFKGKVKATNSLKFRNGAYAHCWYGIGIPHVEVNKAWYNDYEKLKKQYEKDLESHIRPATSYSPETVIPPWHPIGTTVDSIVTHELGRALDDYLSHYLRVQSAGKKTLSSEMRPQIAKECGVKVRDMQSEVSRYSAQDASEWFAECFAEYMDSPTPRRVAKAFGKRLEEVVRRANNGNL